MVLLASSSLDFLVYYLVLVSLVLQLHPLLTLHVLDAGKAGKKYFTIIVATNYSFNRGTIHATSKDITVDPAYDPKYFDYDIGVNRPTIEGIIGGNNDSEMLFACLPSVQNMQRQQWVEL